MKERTQKREAPSTNLVSVGFDLKTLTLEVEFSTGAIYQYYNVPEHIHRELMQAGSKGKFLHQHIRNVYPYSRVG